QNITFASTWTTSNANIASLQLKDAVVGSSYNTTLVPVGTAPYEWKVPSNVATGGAEDILDYCAMPLPDRNNFHMAASGLYKAYRVDAGLLWWIKNTAGNPWDGELFDGVAVYQWFTEGATFLN